ncbi:50S ribosomal protein L25/general stress protein Ctc, partial [Desulfotomaculum copahuensis]
MAQAVLQAELRTGRGRSCRNKLAAQGRVPAVVYSKHIGSLAVETELRRLEAILNSETGRNTLINLQVGGSGNYQVLIKEMQTDPVRQMLLHVDFQQISLKEKIHTTVPLHLTGEPAGVVQGGILQQSLRELEISCLPTDIPETVTVDVAALNMGDAITVADIAAPPGVTVLTGGETVVASVLAPVLEKEPAAEPAAEEAPPAEEP